jgi:PTS system ascorbate-specific IIC component
LGILLGKASNAIGPAGIYVIVAILLIILLIPNFIKTKTHAINNVQG